MRKWLIFVVMLGAAVVMSKAVADSGEFSCSGGVWLIEGIVIAMCWYAAVLVFHDHGTWRLARPVVLLLASIAVLIISSTRPVDIDMAKLGYRMPAPLAGDDAKLVEMELEKANSEITMRVGQEDTWFHYKFLLIGGLLAAFGGVFTFGESKLGIELSGVANSPITCTLLALACVVALSIDIHLRNNIIVIQQLGLWIGRYAEPALMPSNPGGFQAWEQFLRSPGGGMHRDNLYGFAFYPHLHFLTWVVYALYLCCFHALAADTVREPERKQPYALLCAGFIFVHIAFAVFAWVGHFVPGAFVTNILPFGAECWRTGLSAAFGYFLLAVMLVVLNGPFFWQFVRLAWKTR